MRIKISNPFAVDVFWKELLLHVIMQAAISLILSKLMIRAGYITNQDYDLGIEKEKN